VNSESKLFLAGRGLIATHNSPLAAGVGLYCMLADSEPGAQVYAAATTLDQADVLFQDAVRMARNNPAIWGRIIPAGKDHVRALTVGAGRAKGSFFKPVTHMIGRRGGSGPRPSCVLIDELHEHPDRAVVDILERGFKFRRQPLIMMLTNSGFDLRSVCWEEREHAVRALSGDASGDDTFAYICSLDKGDDPFRNTACWIKANPLLGVILSEEYLAGVVAQAKSIPGRRNNILRLHFCRWTDAETAWLDRETWTACEDESLSIEDYAGCRARLGLDLSSRKDLVGVSVVIDTGDTNEAGKPIFAVFAKSYTPAATLRVRGDVDRAPYDVWVEQGYLTATPGEIIKFKHVIADLADLQQLLNVEAVAYDRYLIARFEEDLEEEGVDLPLIEHPQGWSRRKATKLWMPGSIQLLEEWIADRRLRIEVNPVLRAAVAGAKFLTSPTELRRFDKAHATQRIDPLIALTQAIGAWGLTEEPVDDGSWHNAREAQSDEQMARRVQQYTGDDDDDTEFR
jgi:phage terminase large subunit-like protein